MKTNELITQRLNVIAAEKERFLQLLAIAANSADRRRLERGRRDLEEEESKLSALLDAAVETP
jgi:hypothetical protein